MTPFMAVIIVVWSTGSPAEPNGRSAPIYREVFPDKQICEIALEENLKDVLPLYLAQPQTKHVLAGCVPATGKDA